MDRLIDNPDQRLASDINAFTDTALSLSLVLLSSATDLVSFSGDPFPRPPTTHLPWRRDPRSGPPRRPSAAAPPRP